MKQIFFILSSVLFLSVGFVQCTDKREQLKPWSEPASVTGKYRNLFVEAGYSEADVKAKLDKAFYDVFQGPEKVYVEVEDSLAYISDVKNKDVRTEGMSYGMMIAVQWDKQEMFDRLWRWSQKYMQHQEGSSEAYFAWCCNVDGSQRYTGSASDGELYYITSLLFASNRWGNEGGIDYAAQARRILDAMFLKDGTDGVTCLINKQHKLITFVPSAGGDAFTDPSYHLPAFYEVWAQYDEGRREFWKECATRARQYLHLACHPQTGLTSDYTEYDGTPKNTNFHPGDKFRFDSWRVPMNIVMDYVWYGKDAEWQMAYADKLQNFLYGQGIHCFPDQYNLEGTPVDSVLQAGGYQKLRHSIGLVGTSASLSLLRSDNQGWEFIDELWNAELKPYDDGYYDGYYDGLLYLFSLMHLSGNYRLILE